MSIEYTKHQPLGSWSEKGMEPRDKKVTLIHPSEADNYTKRELIEYLHEAAPRDMVTYLGLFGNWRNVVKAKSVNEIHDAVAETWQRRGGDSFEHCAGDGPRDEDMGRAMPPLAWMQLDPHQ